MSEPPVRARPGRLLRMGVAVAVLLALAGYLVARHSSGGPGAVRCQVVSGKGDGAVFRFTPEQAVNAATVSAVGTSRGMPERAVTIALATALQESGLRNLDHGDRDSLGLFQQRPSMGWGTPAEIRDPVHASTAFYEHLERIPGYSRLPLTVAAQRVQRSGYPQAYAKHEPDATLLSAALTGRAAATLTCAGAPSGVPGDPARVREALVRDFGRDVLVDTGSVVRGAGGGHGAAASREPAPSADRETVTVPVAAAGTTGAGARRHGWELAHWAVAHADMLGITRVRYAGRAWSAAAADGAWRADGGASGPQSAPDAVRITTGG